VLRLHAPNEPQRRGLAVRRGFDPEGHPRTSTPMRGGKECKRRATADSSAGEPVRQR
jgi:hypothetical protein